MQQKNYGDTGTVGFDHTNVTSTSAENAIENDHVETQEEANIFKIMAQDSSTTTLPKNSSNNDELKKHTTKATKNHRGRQTPSKPTDDAKAGAIAKLVSPCPKSPKPCSRFIARMRSESEAEARSRDDQNVVEAREGDETFSRGRESRSLSFSDSCCGTYSPIATTTEKGKTALLLHCLMREQSATDQSQTQGQTQTQDQSRLTLYRHGAAAQDSQRADSLFCAQSKEFPPATIPVALNDMNPPASSTNNILDHDSTSSSLHLLEVHKNPLLSEYSDKDAEEIKRASFILCCMKRSSSSTGDVSSRSGIKAVASTVTELPLPPQDVSASMIVPSYPHHPTTLYSYPTVPGTGYPPQLVQMMNPQLVPPSSYPQYAGFLGRDPRNMMNYSSMNYHEWSRCNIPYGGYYPKHHQRPQAPLPQSFLHSNPFLTLSRPEDEKELNSLHCFVRQHLLQITISDPTESDNEDSANSSHQSPMKRNRNGTKRGDTVIQEEPIRNPDLDFSIGPTISIQCRYCAHIPKKLRSKMSTLYPKSTSEIYRAVCTWQRVHFSNCTEIPPNVKEHYQFLKTKDKSRGKTKYWMESARDLGLRDCPSGKGVRFLWSKLCTPCGGDAERK